jgi:hypothetical protein
VEAFELALQCVDALGGVEGVGFHEQQRKKGSHLES